MKSLTLEGTERKGFGGRQAEQLRREGMIPCIIYGGSETVHFYAPYMAFRHIVFNPDFFTIQITVNGKQYNTLLKEVQFHVVTDKVAHLDFLELSPEKTVTAEIPVKLVGQAPGVKSGGILDHKMKRLKVKALPKDLIEHIDVNIDGLELGKSIRVEDIKLQNIQILNPTYMPIAATYIPRVVVEEVKPAAVVAGEAAAAPAEGAAPAAGAKPAEGGKPAAGEKKAEGKAPAKAAEKKPEGKK